MWRRALEAQLHLPAPADSGWELVVKDNHEVLQPMLMINEQAIEFSLDADVLLVQHGDVHVHGTNLDAHKPANVKHNAEICGLL